MSERFTEEQVRRIFARAARRQHTTAVPDGLSRADLEAIARDVGLEAGLVAEAIAAERVEIAADDGRRVRVLSSDVSDREWEEIVDLLRSKAGGPGVAQQVGRRREWAAPGPTVGGVSLSSVEVTPTEDGTVLAVVPRKTTSAKTSAWLLATVMTLNAAIYGGIFVSTGRPTVAAVVVVVSMLLAVACLVGIPILARRREAATQDQIDGLLDRIDLLSRADDDRPRGRIRLDALGDALDDEPARPRGRTRA
ncbi:hypothetical protein [Rubrivirga sp.]|uniref:hypothetical protein n=1 Tax=Rubrivirga sp. TaxID=1885344 RepID=UPI003C78F8A7